MSAPEQPEIDEKGLAEWFNYGMGELQYYLLKVSRFEQWCARHPKEEESEE